MTPLTLASSSLARRKLLADAGLRLEAISADLDEEAVKADLKAQGRTPAALAEVLARMKALRVSGQTAGLVIGADQTLELDGVLYDKPHDRAQAREQLKAFRGRPHRLHSAVAIAAGGAVVWSLVDTATLYVRDFSDVFLEGYLDREGDAVLGCVGGYRLEGEGVQLFEQIEGDYFTVLGLPLLSLLAALRAHGVAAS